MRIGSVFPLVFLVHVLSFFTFCAAPAYANLPDVPAPIDTQLFQGKQEDIAAFVEKHQKQISAVTDQIVADMKSVEAEKEKTAFSALLDLFQGFTFQLKNLLAELNRPEAPPQQIPLLGVEPYKLATFDEIVAFQQKIRQQLKEYEENQTHTEARIAGMKDELIAVLPLYVQMKDDPAKRVEAYERLAYLLTLQHEYAILQIQKPKLLSAFNQAKATDKDVEKLVQEVFVQLRLTREDLDKQKENTKRLGEHAVGVLARLNSEYLDLNKQIVVLESRLDKLASAGVQDADNGVNDGREQEKVRLRLQLDAISFRQKAIIQEKGKLGLSVKGKSFRESWVQADVEKASNKELAALGEECRKEIKELGARKEMAVQELSLAIQKRSELAQRLAASEQSGAVEGSVPVAVSPQVKKTAAALDAYIQILSDNIHDLNRIQENMQLMQGLLHHRLDSFDRITVWVLSFFGEKWGQVRDVLVYPLITIGDMSITLVNIFKVISMFLVGVWLLKILRQRTTRLLVEKTAMTPGAVNSLTTLVYYAALVVGLLVILSTIGFHVSQLGMIFGALSVGLGFGLQTISNNFISGIILLTEQTLQVGDCVALQSGVDGQVRKISIRATIIRTFDGEDVIVPNSELVAGRVNTWSYEDNWRRLKIPFGVSYEADPAEVVRLAEEAAREVRVTREDTAHPLRVFFEGFGANSLDFSIRPWCWMNQINAQTGMVSDYYFALFRKFREAGIEIPYPQTDLHLRSISPAARAVLEQLAAGREKG